MEPLLVKNFPILTNQVALASIIIIILLAKWKSCLAFGLPVLLETYPRPGGRWITGMNCLVHSLPWSTPPLMYADSTHSSSRSMCRRIGNPFRSCAWSISRVTEETVMCRENYEPCRKTKVGGFYIYADRRERGVLPRPTPILPPTFYISLIVLLYLPVELWAGQTELNEAWLDYDSAGAFAS